MLLQLLFILMPVLIFAGAIQKGMIVEARLAWALIVIAIFDMLLARRIKMAKIKGPGDPGP